MMDHKPWYEMKQPEDNKAGYPITNRGYHRRQSKKEIDIIRHFLCKKCDTIESIEAPHSVTYCTNCESKLIELIEAHPDKHSEGEMLPWCRPELKGWSIVGMNHYHQEGRRYLFCSMAKDGICITSEGLDENVVFDRLAELTNNHG